MKHEKIEEPQSQQHLDKALEQCECIQDYEDIIELWETYGGD